MVGERMREVRLGQRLSLTQVAQKAGISAATLSRIETNKQSVDVALLQSIARILKVTAHVFLDADGPPPENSDPLARRITTLGTPQRTRLWRDLAAARRAERPARQGAVRALGQQFEELIAHIDFLREEVEAVRTRVRRGR